MAGLTDGAIIADMADGLEVLLAELLGDAQVIDLQLTQLSKADPRRQDLDVQLRKLRKWASIVEGAKK